MLRSQIIALAQGQILQGGTDPFWSYAEWDHFFNEAVDMLHSAFVAADSDFFQSVDATISHTSNGVYTLPSDFHAMMYCEDSEGEIKPLTQYEIKSMEVSGLRIVENTLRLENWQTDWPATLTIDYIREPKDIPAWDGTDDALKGSDATYTPDAPLDTNRGARTLARIMVALAKVKDENITREQYQLAEQIANRFVDRFLSRSQAE